MRTLKNVEIEEIEKELGLKLPSLYHRLLAELGYGRLGPLEIYHPSQIRDLYESFFDDPGQLFRAYFPFGCHNELQEIWVIDVTSEKAASIWHETVPDDWPEEQWLVSEKWIEKCLEPELASARFGTRNEEQR